MLSASLARIRRPHLTPMLRCPEPPPARRLSANTSNANDLVFAAYSSWGNATRARVPAGPPSMAATTFCQSIRTCRLPRAGWRQHYLRRMKTVESSMPSWRRLALDWSDSVVGRGVTGERRPRRRQDRHADAQLKRGGDGGGRHADADAQRWRHRDL